MNPESLVEIKASEYSYQLRVFSPDFVHGTRTLNYTETLQTITVFGNFWIFALGYLDRNQVSVRRRGQLVSGLGNVFMVIPPFSIIEWVVKPERIDYQLALTTNKKLSWAPAEASMCEVEFSKLPQSLDEIRDLFKEPRYFVPVGKEERPSALARKAKAVIDQSYREDIKIAEVAERLGCSHVVMSRQFKACFDISPVVYRNKLRVLDSYWDLILGQTGVADVAHKVGFSDLSQFNRQFKKENNAVPTQFQGKPFAPRKREPHHELH